jgi:hypothetical protein
MFCSQYSLNTLKAFAEHLGLKELSRHKKADLCAVLDKHFGGSAAKITVAITQYDDLVTEQWESVEADLHKAQTQRNDLLHKSTPKSYSSQQVLARDIAEQEEIISTLEKQSRGMLKVLMNLEERDGSMPLEMAEVMADYRDESKQGYIDKVKMLERKVIHLEGVAFELEREKTKLVRTLMQKNLEIDSLRRLSNVQGGYEKRRLGR